MSERDRWGGPSPWAGRDSRTSVQRGQPDPHMVTNYQAQLAAAQRWAAEYVRRLDALAADLRSKGFVVETVGGSMVVRMPEEDVLHTKTGKVLTEAELDSYASDAEHGYQVRCPDDGKCHHGCLAGTCFRVHHAGPLSAAGFPDDAWPAEVREQFGDGGHL